MHYDVCYRKPRFVRRGEEGTDTILVKIGSGYPTAKGSISLWLYGLPVGPWDGRLMLFPHDEPERGVRNVRDSELREAFSVEESVDPLDRDDEEIPDGGV